MNARNLARQRSTTAWGDRIARQATRSRQRQEQEQPALYAGGGEVLPLGAAGPIRPRGIVTSGGLAIGSPVSQSQGLVGGMPAASPGDGEAMRLLKKEVGAVAFARGLQVGEADPNDVQGDDSGEVLLARYPYDRYWRETTATLYYWQPGTESSQGEWVAMLGGIEELNGLFDAPEVRSYTIIHSCRYRTKVVQLLYSGSGTTAALSVADGAVLEVGDSLALDVTVAGSAPLEWTVELLRA